MYNLIFVIFFVFWQSYLLSNRAWYTNDIVVDVNCQMNVIVARSRWIITNTIKSFIVLMLTVVLGSRRGVHILLSVDGIVYQYYHLKRECKHSTLTCVGGLFHGNVNDFFLGSKFFLPLILGYHIIILRYMKYIFDEFTYSFQIVPRK